MVFCGGGELGGGGGRARHTGHHFCHHGMGQAAAAIFFQNGLQFRDGARWMLRDVFDGIVRDHTGTRNILSLRVFSLANEPVLQ